MDRGTAEGHVLPGVARMRTPAGGGEPALMSLSDGRVVWQASQQGKEEQPKAL
jgi:hypothetical protein